MRTISWIVSLAGRPRNKRPAGRTIRCNGMDRCPAAISPAAPSMRVQQQSWAQKEAPKTTRLGPAADLLIDHAGPKIAQIPISEFSLSTFAAGMRAPVDPAHEGSSYSTAA